MRKLILVLVICIACNTSFAQVPTMEQKLYYTCKVWGFVKYFHSGVSSCLVDWDGALLHALPLVRSAATNAAFNDALDTLLAAAGPMAIASSYFPDVLAPELKRNRDWNFMSSSVFRSDVQNILDTIRNNFRPHTGCYIDNGSFSGTLSTAWGGLLKLLPDTVMLDVNTHTSYPDVDHRLLMTFKFWNIVRYFNPYNYILDTHWDTTLYHYTVPVINAPNAHELTMLFLKMATAMNDAHVYGFTYSYSEQILPGAYKPKIVLNHIEGKYVVVKSMETGISPGDVVVSVDGLTPTQWEDSLRPYYSSGNLSVFRRTMCKNLLGRQTAGAAVNIVLTDNTGTDHMFTPTAVAPYTYSSFFYDYFYPNDTLNSIKWTKMQCDVGYVNMGNITTADVNTAYTELMTTPAIIFDIRNYPNGTGWDFVNLMYPAYMEFAKFLSPDVTYPGTYSWYHDFGGYNGNPTAYAGKVIILVNQETQSQAEFTTMMLRRMPGSVVIGSQTAGADGDVTWMKISQDMRFGWTSDGVFYPNGDSTQRIGIVPDVFAYPTINGIRSRRDEVLEKALVMGGCNLHANHLAPLTSDIKVHPNPADDEVIVDFTGIDEGTVSLSDMTGRVLQQKFIKQFGGSAGSVSFDIYLLPPAVYLLTVTANGERRVMKVSKM